MALKVVRNEVDGWDVIREGEDEAISNHVDRATAEAAAQLRADEEGIGEGDDEEAVVVARATRSTGSTTLARACDRRSSRWRPADARSRSSS